MTLPACSDAAKSRTVEVYIEKESTSGTAETLTDADYVEIIDDATLPEAYQRANIENLTRTAGLDVLPDQLGQVVGQELVIKTYVYRSASAGTVPHLTDLFEGLTGTQSVSGGALVVYSASAATSALPSHTVLLKSDNLSMRFAAQVSKAIVSMTPTDDGNALLSVEWTLLIWKWYGAVAGSASGTSTSQVVSFTDSGDSARFMAGGIVSISGSPYTISSVDRTAGTITLASDPGDGAVVMTPWSPGAPASPTWHEYQFLAHENEFKITDMTGVALEELPIRDHVFTWDNALIARNNETGRAIGTICVNRVNARDIMLNFTTIQYSNTAEGITAAAENRNTVVSLVATAADGSGRTFKIFPGTNGVGKIRQAGNGVEDGLLTQSFDVKYCDQYGGNDAAKLVFG